MPVRQEYSVILVIPDASSHSYLRAFSNLLLAKMGFKQLSLQQETLGATFGAGLSAACVVDVGASRTSIACVEDGTVISDTRCDTFAASPLRSRYQEVDRLLLRLFSAYRQSLAYGGNDLTRWLGELLKRSEFPYAELNLQDAMDLKLLQGLKEKVTTLNDVRFFLADPALGSVTYWRADPRAFHRNPAGFAATSRRQRS